MFREIQRQSTSFAYRMSSDHEEWRGARDFDYDDGRPSRVELAQEQAEDDFWAEKERDYPRGYGPPQAEEDGHPGWLYVDGEAPIPDEVTDADLDEEDDFDPYEDEIGDGPLPFDTPIYQPGGGYDDYDKTLSVIEEQEGSGPDIEKFSATEKFDCDGLHNWGPNERCEDCGKEDTREPGDEKPIPKRPKRAGREPLTPEEELAQGVGGERWRKLTYPDLDLDHNAFNRLPEEERRRFAQEYDEYVRGLDQKGKMRLSRKTGRTNPFDRREGMARRVGPGNYEHDSPYGTFGIRQTRNPAYPGPAMWYLHPPGWDGSPDDHPSEVYYTKAEALQAINAMMADPERFGLEKPSQDVVDYSNSLKLGWGDNKQPYKKPPKEPEVAIRNDDVKIMRDSETGLGYDAIVRVNDKGGYDVIKILGAQRNPFRAEVLNAEEEGLDFGGKRWGAGCPEHGNVIGCRSKADAQRMETWEFCDDCREKI